MSLQAWLPLINDIKNQGIADIGLPSKNNSALNSEGKLGSCYSGGLLYHFNQQLLGNKWTVATWVKNSAWATANDILACINVSTSDHYQIYFSIINGETLNLGINGSTTSYSYTFNTNEWYHVAASYDGLNYALYINGNQVKTGTIVAEPYTDCVNLGIGYRSNNTAGTSSTGGNNNKAFNDFRLYDHALSPREIKEISKGLVCHYPLSRNGFGQDNYFSCPDFIRGTSSTANLREYSNGLFTLTANTNNLFYQLVPALNEYTSAKIPAGTYIFSIQNWVSNVSMNEVTDLALKVKNSSGSTFLLRNNIPTTLADECSFVEIVGNNTISKGSTISCRFMLEKGSIATPWTPASTDPLYSAMGLNDNKVYDTSGFCNNGSMIGTFSYSGDTPRYQISTSFNGTDNGILIENLQLSNIINTAITYSFWVKPSGENGGRSVFFGSYGATSWSIEKSGENYVRGYWNANPEYTKAKIIDDVWQHICITKDGTSDIKVYINGELKDTSTVAHNALTFPTTYRIGRDTRSGDGTPYAGLMSDFRIYATALSPDEIADLYHTSASLTSNGTLLTSEFQET